MCRHTTVATFEARYRLQDGTRGHFLLRAADACSAVIRALDTLGLAACSLSVRVARGEHAT
jgi:hypothetical protein